MRRSLVLDHRRQRHRHVALTAIHDLGQIESGVLGDTSVDGRELALHARKLLLEVGQQSAIRGPVDLLDLARQDVDGGFELAGALAVALDDGDRQITNFGGQFLLDRRQRFRRARRHQHASPGRHVVTDDIGDRVCLAGAGRPLDDDAVHRVVVQAPHGAYLLVVVRQREKSPRFGRGQAGTGAGGKTAPAGAWLQRLARQDGRAAERIVVRLQRRGLRAGDERHRRLWQSVAVRLFPNALDQRLDIGAAEIGGAPSRVEHPAVHDAQLVVERRGRAVLHILSLVGFVHRGLRQPGAAHPQHMLEAASVGGSEADIGILEAAFELSAAVAQQPAHAGDVERLERAETEFRRSRPRLDDDRAGRLVELEFHQRLDQGRVDPLRGMSPPRDADADDALDRRIVAHGHHALLDVEQAVVERHAAPARLLGFGPAGPRSRDIRGEGGGELGKLGEAERDVNRRGRLGRSLGAGDILDPGESALDEVGDVFGGKRQGS